MNKTFEEYLMEKHIEEESHLTKDMLVDDFNDWLVRIDVDDIINYAQEYADKLIKEKTMKILEAHKIQMDMVNDSFDKADFERKERLENAQDRENELQVEFMQEEKLASKALEDTDCHASPDDGCPHCEQLREGI